VELSISVVEGWNTVQYHLLCN